jgi:hypothetical protein
MYSLKDDRLFADGSDEERRLIVSFNESLEYRWEPQPDGSRRLVFERPCALMNAYEQMNRMGEKGFLFGALLFSRRAGELERQVRSHIMTKLVRTYHDMVDNGRPVRESEVSHAASFVNALLGDLTEMILAWTEDMNTDDPNFDLASQPTAVIRGTLFSSNVDQRKACRFWELAAESPRFPERIFCDPCPPANGSIFMPYHTRIIGLIFSIVSEPAVRHFATVIKEQAVKKGILLNEDDNRKHRVVIMPASENEIHAIRANIVGHITDNDRKQLVASIFA